MAYNYAYAPQDASREFDFSNNFYDGSYDMDVPMFTAQDLYAFEPAQQMIYGQTNGMEGGMADYDMGMGMEMGYMNYGMDSEFQGDMNGFVGSCQASPFANQMNLNPPMPASFMASSSPVTPSGSPMQSFYEHPGQPTYVLVPTSNDGQYQQYSAFQVTPESYLGNITLPAPQPTFVPSPVEEPPALEAEDEEEEEESENDASILPNCGNTELRGMGLYDDSPELFHGDLSSTPLNGSPITPTDQLRPTLGKGLMLERSFGLPEEMMMKDEVSGKIVKGKLVVDDEPVIYHDMMFQHVY